MVNHRRRVCSGCGLGPQSGVAALSDAAKSAVRAALATWSSVANIHFIETADNASGHGTLRFAWTASPVNEQSFTYGPGTSDKAGDIWLNSLAPWDSFAPGSYGYSTLIHEMGHALGLKHPFEGAVKLPAQQESYSYSLMSYTAYAGSAGSWVDFEPTTPMLYDLLAIQSMYGVNPTTRSGDDTYVFTENQRYFQTLWDAGGNDTIVWQGQSQGTRIDLNAGKFSQLGEPLTYWSEDFSSSWTDRDTVSIAFGVAIENAVGGDANDTLIGNTLVNRLTGGLGNDSLDGGAGLDTGAYSTRHAAYTVAAGGSGWSVGGPDGTDTLTGIERLQFQDAHLGFDVDGSAGQVYRLYKAAFARTPDLAGLGYWVARMDDGTVSLEQTANGFIASAEFQSLYGARSSNGQFVTALYLNVMGRAPDAGGYGYWVNQLASSLQSRAQALVAFSESGENKSATASLSANGILYASAEQAAGPARGQLWSGTSGADTLIGSVGADTFNGGAGIDISLYGGNRSTHTVTRTADGLTVSGGADGSDTLVNVERLKFADIALAFDLNGNAGQTYRLYQAAFDRTPDTAGLSDWIRGMDAGMSLKTVASGFIGSAEFRDLYGANLTNTQFIDLLYANALNRAPDQTGYDYWSEHDA